MYSEFSAGPQLCCFGRCFKCLGVAEADQLQLVGAQATSCGSSTAVELVNCCLARSSGLVVDCFFAISVLVATAVEFS